MIRLDFVLERFSGVSLYVYHTYTKKRLGTNPEPPGATYNHNILSKLTKNRILAFETKN